MKKILLLLLLLQINCAFCKDLFKADYSDFSMEKLINLSNSKYAFEMDRACQSPYNFYGKEEICADFYYYWKGFKNDRETDNNR